jgi:hypothetical protein
LNPVILSVSKVGIPASSTTKTGRHDIAEILLKVALNTKNKKINQLFYCQYQKEEGNCSL